MSVAAVATPGVVASVRAQSFCAMAGTSSCDTQSSTFASLSNTLLTTSLLSCAPAPPLHAPVTVHPLGRGTPAQRATMLPSSAAVVAESTSTRCDVPSGSSTSTVMTFCWEDAVNSSSDGG